MLALYSKIKTAKIWTGQAGSYATFSLQQQAAISKYASLTSLSLRKIPQSNLGWFFFVWQIRSLNVRACPVACTRACAVDHAKFKTYENFLKVSRSIMRKFAPMKIFRYMVDCITECSSVQRYCDHVQYLYLGSSLPLLPLLLLSLLQLLVLLLNQGDECVAASLELLEPMEQSYVSPNTIINSM